MEALLDTLTAQVQESLDGALDALMETGDEQMDIAEARTNAWEALLMFVDMEGQRGELFKQPEALAYIEKLQAALAETGIV